MYAIIGAQEISIGLAQKRSDILMALSRLFISHSHGDNRYCEDLVNALQRNGYDAWFDEQNPRNQ
jgi:hypothetical protein